MAHAARPFHLQVPEAALSELKERLARTRWPEEPPPEQPELPAREVREFFQGVA